MHVELYNLTYLCSLLSSKDELLLYTVTPDEEDVAEVSESEIEACRPLTHAVAVTGVWLG